MISSDIIRGYIDLMILYVLLENESYGYEISKRIADISEKKYTIKETTLYSAFSRLERNEYIYSFNKDEPYAKKRVYYRITKDGLNYYKNKCSEWDLTQDIVKRFIREVE